MVSLKSSIRSIKIYIVAFSIFLLVSLLVGEEVILAPTDDICIANEGAMDYDDSSNYNVGNHRLLSIANYRC
jgi:hypothetical protein